MISSGSIPESGATESIHFFPLLMGSPVKYLKFLLVGYNIDIYNIHNLST